MRELENVLERAIVISEGDVIEPQSLPTEIREPAPVASAGGSLQETVDAFERQLLLRALEDSEYVQSKAAQRLGLSKSALHYKLTRHRIRTTRS
ncbi:Nif-specific regulatory protein [compost metagenome]